MRIVRIIARLNVGGPARHVVWLTVGLRAMGHDSTLVAGTVPPGEDDMSYFARAEGVEPLIIREMSREVSPKDALTIWKLYRLLCRLRPDVVHTHTAKAGTVGRLAGLLYRWLTPSSFVGRPRRCYLVHTYHGHVFHSYYGRIKTRIFLSIEQLLARIATDRIVVISPQQYGEIHGRFRVGRANQFAVIPLGLDVSQFAEADERRQRMRRELSVSETDVLVGIVGRLVEVKNHRMFLRAAAVYKKHGEAGEDKRRVRFLVIGDGHLRSVLEAEAGALGIAERVTFLGSRNDPQNFYPALDVVALTSLNEGTPLTLIEAMANRRAVIATAVGGVVDLLGKDFDEHGQATVAAAAGDFRAGNETGDELSRNYQIAERGVLVQPNDVEGFCDGLTRLIRDLPLRQAMGARGFSYVTSNYAKERLIANVKDLYDELMLSNIIDEHRKKAVQKKSHIVER